MLASRAFFRSLFVILLSMLAHIGCSSTLSTDSVSTAPGKVPPDQTSDKAAGQITSVRAEALADDFSQRLAGLPELGSIAIAKLKQMFQQALGTSDLSGLDAASADKAFATLAAELMSQLLPSLPESERAAAATKIATLLKATVAATLPPEVLDAVRSTIDSQAQDAQHHGGAAAGGDDGDDQGGDDGSTSPPAAPTPDLSAGTYTAAQSVALATAVPGGVIYYTLDGSAPTTASNLYTSPLVIGVTTTVKSIVVTPDGSVSGVTTTVYTITGTVAAPSLSPAGATYTSAHSVTLTTSTVGAAIHYTTDGSLPTSASPLYTTPINVGSSQTVKALAVKADWLASAVTSESYTINLIPAPGSFSASATAGNASVILNWGASTNATGYEIRRGTTSGTYPTSVTTTTGTSYTDNDAALVNGTTYYYQIIATNVTGSANATASATPVTISLSLSTVTASASSVNSGGTVTVQLTAKDSLGNQQTEGGLTVTFDLGSGTSGGSFDVVDDHDDGTYTAVFTASTAGTARALTAQIDGQTVTSSMPTITVVTPPPSNAWSSASVTGLPQICGNAYVVWSGTEMIVWGGGCSVYGNTGARYNPANDTWTATSTTNAPAGRNAAVALWSGTEMYIWGGTTSGYENTGARYNPSNDTWTTMTTTGAPTARMDAVGVWTGSKLLIYGGNSYAGAHNDGKAYSPGGPDTWTAMTTHSGATDWSSGADAVWAGSRMLFTSGVNTDRLAYNPSNDSWSTLSGSGAPSPRYDAVVLSTGTKMVIWGGYMMGAPMDPVYYYNDGAFYDPSNGTWEAISTAGAPVPRRNARGVWTGSKLIVWGGNDENGLTLSGGIYDPATTTWTPISTTNAPTNNDATAAVWTGTQMILWGYTPGIGNFARIFTP